jgi:hypothetical protein
MALYPCSRLKGARLVVPTSAARDDDDGPPIVKREHSAPPTIRGLQLDRR